MPLITNLPAASSLSASDLLIKDTGSTTQKIAVSAAYASESQPGFVSTGAQTFAGLKTFEANAININGAIAYPGIQIFNQNAPGNTRMGGFRFNLGAATPDRTAAYIEQASLSNGTPTGFYENYYFPRTTDGLSASVSYNILTTKDYQLAQVQRLTIPANGSLTITLATGSRGVAFLSSYNAGTKGLCILCSDNTSATYKLIGDPTYISVSASGTSLTFTSTYTYGVVLGVFMFLGSVSA